MRGAAVAVTGANRGLGRALVSAFARHGARVLVHARRDADARQVADALGPDACAVSGDLLDPTLPAALAAQARARFGRLDLLVLNAGLLGPMKPLADLDPADFTEVMRVNVDAQLTLFQACLPLLRAARGSVVLGLTSGLGRFALPNYGPYCASKHALEGLLKTIAVEHQADRIVAAAIAPGMVRTDMLKAALGTDDVSEHQDPDATAEAFVRFVQALTFEDAGRSLDIGPWLGE